MKMNYRQKLFLYFGIIFALFTLGIAAFEQSRERKLNTKALEERLESYTDIIHAGLLQRDSTGKNNLQQIQSLLPKNLRITLIDADGRVQFDNSIEDLSGLDNHLHRPEIQSALAHGRGSHIRLSDSNEKKYLYFARLYDRSYIRAALPYNIGVQHFLKPDNASLYFILAFFIFFLFIIHFITKSFEKSVRQLRDFAFNSESIKHNNISFPKNELGEIGRKIADQYGELKESQQKNIREKQKLLQHIQILEEGICFFSADGRVDFHNGLFIQYLNTLTDEPAGKAEMILSDPAFAEVQQFLLRGDHSYFETQIKKQGKTFSLRANIFEDRSFEITLNDITKQERTRSLKQEMTDNIAHELRTPVTSIRGYLETVLSPLPDEKKKQYFIEKAFNQAVMLSAIIQDMGQLAKMEEAPESFAFEETYIANLLETIKAEALPDLAARNMSFDFHIPAGAAIMGNPVLLHSLFRNLTENAIRYAGENTGIVVTIYNEDADYYYLSFYDTGTGIPDDRQLNRIFERFYRISEGRTRDKGGSGLGLSIVKNAVLFHQGKIIAKNRKDGGLEFLFSLRKRRK